MAERKRRRADSTDTANNAPRQAFGPTEASNALAGNTFSGSTNINFNGGIGEEQRARVEKDACLRSLAFGEIHARHSDIVFALQDTCEWLFETPEFHRWRDSDDYDTHNGVLWIKGKPGAGKSTLMKHALARYRENYFRDHLIVAHFFNARGTTLEKTPLGLMRSIVHQLIQDDEMYSLFTPVLRQKKQIFAREADWQWRLSELQGFIRSVVTRPSPGLRPLFILVDALDECDEAVVRDVVLFLESLSIHAHRGGLPLRICLSSRHYPSIQMRKVVELTVDGMQGHRADIAKYVSETLRIQGTEMEAAIIEKADSVFLWVVIVVSILNKAYDEGRVEAMQKALDELPEDLDKVFASILNNVADTAETLFILQWVLLSERPLKLDELFAAVFLEVALPDVATIKRRITTSSKGLVEVRKGEHYQSDSVQFIHLSVKDFLYRRKILSTIDPSLEPEPIMSSHCRLWARCWAATEPAVNTVIDREYMLNAIRNDPFFLYAASNVLYHAERALSGGVTRANRDGEDASEPVDTSHQVLIKQWLRRADHWLHWWIMFLRATRREEDFRLRNESEAGLQYILALFQLPNLLRTSLADTGIDALGGYYGNALQAASYARNKNIVQLLLDAGADVNAQGGECGNALQAASHTGDKDIVQLLLDAGADVNAQGGEFGNALQAASYTGDKDIVQLLLDVGADVNTQGGEYGNALQAACLSKENEQMVQLLLDVGADVNAQGGKYGNALQATCLNKRNEQMVQLLLDAGVDVNTQGGEYGNALQAACLFKENEQMVQLLLDVGADVNAQGGEYGNALQAASHTGDKDIVQLLLDVGADVNAQGGYYGNALQAASNTYNKDIVQLLLDVGANVNAQGGYYGNALQVACLNKSNEQMVQLLLDAGADVNAQGGKYGNALQAASYKGVKDIVQLLLEAGADPDV
ncbi:ankyrin repeat domain-containing protein 50 [Microdochium nivale]|nr:ankyrin repeat domain-containing protein 50 [Microdochium nivale]